jgi:uncharacterized protein YecE (DUF72 family)
MNQWYIGTIGYSYKEWMGGFYPTGIKPRDYLPYYSKVFNSVEIDTTFHSLPRLESVQSWSASVPSGFKISLKTPRGITHEMKLYHAESIMAEFIDTIQPLKDRLGPVLIQLPPSFRIDSFNILQDFLKELPPVCLYAIELRHPSWFIEETVKLLSQFHICWAAIDFPNIPRQIVRTTDFLYIRWIGINGMYQHHSFERIDKTDHLKWWIDAIHAAMTEGMAIYGYFNNDYTGFAAGSCKRFMVMAGLMDEENNMPYQERLF